MSVFKRKNSRSPYYWYEFQIEGRRFNGSTKSTNLREAEAFERAERHRAEEQLALERADPARTTVEQVFERYWDSHGRTLSWAPTLREHMIGLEVFLGGDKPFKDITGADIAAALEAYATTEGRRNRGGSMRPGRPSKSTVNRRLAAFSAIYNMARDKWQLPVTHIKLSTYKRKEPKSRVRHISREEAKHLLSKLPRHIKLIVAWSLATGCRKDETETLRWTRVNFETMQAEVETKGGGTRFVEINDDAMLVLTECDRNRPLVFDHRNIRKHYEKALADAGIEDFTFHDLRHTFATWLGNAIGDLAVVMKALGHTQIHTTMKYRHVIRADVRRGVQSLPPIFEATRVARFQPVVRHRKARGAGPG